MTKLTETMSMKRSELQLHRDDGLELHECFSLDNPVVPLDLPEQWDELTGEALDLEKVVKGRLKELQKFKERGVRKFVKTRCRLVAQELAKRRSSRRSFGWHTTSFRGKTACQQNSEFARKCTLTVLDVSCAFLYADINRRVYIELPAEDPGSTSGKVVGKLEKALYGTRDAPQAWLDELSKTLVGIGFTMTARFPGVYFHERLEVALVTHVDDLLCSGSDENLNWVRAELLKKYEVKGQVMAEGNTEVKFLGRTIGRNERGFYWEEDSKHRDVLLEEWNFVHPEMPKQVTVLSDSDWAGDQATRRSTSGVMIFHGADLLLFASRLQKTVALSSGEAELNAQVMGMSEGLGVSGVCGQWCLGSELACFCDSSAARGIASRAVVGRMKQLEVRPLWVQEKVREGRATVSWLSRCQNSADALTRPCSASQMQEHLCHAGVEVRSELDSSARGGCWLRAPGGAVNTRSIHYTTCLDPECLWQT